MNYDNGAQNFESGYLLASGISFLKKYFIGIVFIYAFLGIVGNSAIAANESSSTNLGPQPVNANNSYVLAAGTLSAPGGSNTNRSFIINTAPCAAKSVPTVQFATIGAWGHGENWMGSARKIQSFGTYVKSVSAYDPAKQGYTVNYQNNVASVASDTFGDNSWDNGANATISWTLYCMR